MAPFKVYVTCPPMLKLIEEFGPAFASHELECVPAVVTQVKTEAELIETLPDFDGWILGDDPATQAVVAAAAAGKLKAAIKWGVGIDNVDFDAFRSHNVKIDHTPGVFGGEVADVALAYVLGLARQTYLIDREIRLNNAWPKPSGATMDGKTIALVGFGDIGRQTARRLLGFGTRVIVYDPAYRPDERLDVTPASWPDRLGEADFIVFTCPLNPSTRGMFSHEILDKLKPGVRVVNVARGPVVVEAALIDALKSGVVHSAALDVFEVEPLPPDSELRSFEKCIFGSHNASNTVEAVRRVSLLAIEKISNFLHER